MNCPVCLGETAETYWAEDWVLGIIYTIKRCVNDHKFGWAEKREG